MTQFEHANGLLTALFVGMCAMIVGSILLAQRGRSMFIRRIPGLSAIEEAVGRATEMGRPMYFSPGLWGIDIITLQALAILTYIVRLAATQATRVIVGTADSTLLPVAEESVREAYASVGKQALFRAEDVRFVSGDQFAYALGSVGIMAREQTASNFYFGAFFAEALILTENGRAQGALQVAGCPDPTQIPFFIATCDYVVIGDEYYAASAYLTREPTLTGSLVGQDLAKAGLAALIVLGIISATVWAGHVPHFMARFMSLLGAGSMLLAALFTPIRDHTVNVVLILGSLLFSAVVLALAHTFLRTRGRRTLIVAVTFLGGLFFALEYFWPTHLLKGQQVNFLTDWIEPATIGLSVIGAFTVGLGVHSLSQVHGRVLLRRRPGWYNSLAFFVSMIAMLVFALWDFYAKAKPSATGVIPFPNAVYEILFNGIFQPLIAATFSLLAFYIASAAYRAFRIRSAEAALMMAAAFIVMLAQVPLGAWLTHGIPQTGPLGFLGFFRLERFGDWILKWWNSPAQRGITFGVAVGALAMSLRVWLSLERGTFFSDQPEASREDGLAGSTTEP